VHPENPSCVAPVCDGGKSLGDLGLLAPLGFGTLSACRARLVTQIRADNRPNNARDGRDDRCDISYLRPASRRSADRDDQEQGDERSDRNVERIAEFEALIVGRALSIECRLGVCWRVRICVV
jgi:hypothetical protein